MTRYLILIAIIILAMLGVSAQKAAAAPKPSKLETVTVTGDIKAIGTQETPRGLALVTIDIAGAFGKTTKVALLAKEQLDAMALKPAVGMKVTVEGVKPPKVAKGREVDLPNMVVATKVTADGKTYTLRGANAGGPPVMTVAGTIKKVVVTTPKPADPKAKPAEPQVTLILLTDKGLIAAHLGPQALLTKLKVTPKEEMAVKVNGWAQGQPKKPGDSKLAELIVARAITLNGKTITLREADGRLVGTAKPAPPKSPAKK